MLVSEMELEICVGEPIWWSIWIRHMWDQGGICCVLRRMMTLWRPKTLEEKWEIGEKRRRHVQWVPMPTIGQRCLNRTDDLCPNIQGSWWLRNIFSTIWCNYIVHIYTKALSLLRKWYCKLNTLRKYLFVCAWRSKYSLREWRDNGQVRQVHVSSSGQR